ncbi:uncharacterized protein si:zfos-1056e6.1 isoform X2 [Betta splendens]|uniref:Uncharacterized protein si:zfos-1056e6.1 isoform X2 n=1 Tax=Betta splendens TaxID=158456 RepID=A0A9W2XNE0_BETSP|nr:uncharacterized protein si:zfos-1056e6.1 isoform X2 [Betta splendens]
MEMSDLTLDEAPAVSKIWMVLRRLDRNDDRVVALREASIPAAADVTTTIQIITSTFGINSSDVAFKMRNQRGCLIPLNGSIRANSKHTPYVLEVARFFQHVRPQRRTIPMTVINKTMKTRLQSIDRRIQRLEELLPQINLRRDDRLNQDIECLSQKLRFLQNRMQMLTAGRAR